MGPRLGSCRLLDPQYAMPPQQISVRVQCRRRDRGSGRSVAAFERCGDAPTRIAAGLELVRADVARSVARRSESRSAGQPCRTPWSGTESRRNRCPRAARAHRPAGALRSRHAHRRPGRSRRWFAPANGGKPSNQRRGGSPWGSRQHSGIGWWRASPGESVSRSTSSAHSATRRHTPPSLRAPDPRPRRRAAAGQGSASCLADCSTATSPQSTRP